MNRPVRAYSGARIFDGAALLSGQVLMSYADGTTQIAPPSAVPEGCPITPCAGGILMPGFTDLQVNGGGGVMLNDAPTVETLATIAKAHRALGTRAILPTLITDTPDQTTAAIAAVSAACAREMPGIVGLHLEGPHLSVARKGAHDAALIRPMSDADLAELCAAAEHLPSLMVTLAPESVTPAQINTLVRAGVIVSLGHSACDYDTAMRAFEAGARAATHLFNAMSQPSARAPGLVGAALDHPGVLCGLIADGVHVHPALIRTALAAKSDPAASPHPGMFLITDAMAVAGTDNSAFHLNGREITRSGGRLTLADGTLAGADLSIAQALGVMVNTVRVPLERALAMATTIPNAVLNGAANAPGQGAPAADMIWLSDDFRMVQWLSAL